MAIIYLSNMEPVGDNDVLREVLWENGQIGMLTKVINVDDIRPQAKKAQKTEEPKQQGRIIR